jgi:hypothetical protein
VFENGEELSEDRTPILDERDSVSYEEFGGDQDYVNCQSCQGTGRLPRSQQQELVALIPYDDDRLKPKRTALWVTMGVVLAILACGLVAGSLVYILVPRTVVVEFIPPIRNNVTFTSTNETHMNLTIPLRVANPNFSNANFTSVETEVSFLTSQVGQETNTEYQILGKRTDQLWHNITTMLMFSKDNHLTWLKDYCTREQSGPKIISLNIQISTNVTFRNAVQQTAIKQLCYISCDPNTNALSNCQ